MPLAILPLAVISAAPASQAGSGWVNRQRRGPRGKIQALQIPEVVVMWQRCSSLSGLAYPQGRCCMGSQLPMCSPVSRSLTAPRIDIEGEMPLCEADKAPFKPDIVLSIEERLRQSTSDTLPCTAHTSARCPVSKPGASKVEPRIKQVFVPQEKKQALHRKVKYLNQPAVKTPISFHLGYLKFFSLPLYPVDSPPSCPTVLLPSSCCVPPSGGLPTRREEQFLHASAYCLQSALGSFVINPSECDLLS